MMARLPEDRAMPPVETPAAEVEKLFAAVPERNTGDTLLRTMQMHHVQLSAMADTKANIIITMSSIVLTLVLGRLNDPDLRTASLTLAAFTLLALLLAVLAVLPKYRPLKLVDGTIPPQFNLLFFGHFAELPRERFLAEIAGALKADGSVYETMARDTYALGWYLANHKYRYLRLSYIFFLAGFILACIVQVISLLAR
jgi:hypothetical protein